MLYQIEFNPEVSAETIREMLQASLPDEELRRFAWSLFAGTREVRPYLDELIEKTAAHWKLQRMTSTDRNVLRLGAYELLYTDTPPRVVIDEAVELAKTFGTSGSAAFVNGILDRLIPPHKRTSQA